MSIGQGTRVGRLRIRVDRVIYTTITLLSVLIIYDGWNQLTFWGVLAVILGPMLAIFLGHLFGAELGTRVALVVTGVVSLGVWGGVAGRRAGLTGWRLAAATGYGLLLGCVILALQALLQPGQEPFQR